MSDNPFQNPEDDRTVVFRPVPGGRPTPARSEPPPAYDAPRYAPPPQPSAEPSPSGEPIGRLATGYPPLVEAAMPLLALLGRLRNTYNPPDPGDLRQRTIQAIRDFETAGREKNIARETMHTARYALCASIDDIVLHTQWGRASPWVQASLVSSFHQEVVSGENFFRQLDALKREPARNLPLLELMYLCLSLGYQGQYRVRPYTPAQLELVREDLYQTIVRQRAAYEQGLSPHWLGVAAPYRPARAVVPVWVMAAVSVATVALCWFILSTRLNAASDQVFAQASSTPPQRMPRLDRPPPPPIPAPAPLRVAPPPVVESLVVKSLHRFLQREIDAKLVVVSETPQAIEVRVFNRGMFDLGSATVRPDFLPLLQRIGDALNEEPGAVLITGHTDNLPIHTAAFPSNFQLSLARAKAASAVVLRQLRDPQRLLVEGRADGQPIASNATPDGQAQNRRIDVILQRRN